MQKNNLKNITRQALQPKKLTVMAKKVLRRLVDKSVSLPNTENLAWLEKSCVDYVALAQELDAELWAESVAAEQEIEAHSVKVLAEIEHDLGGGGIYPFLYFLTRRHRPRHVVETGVAAGFSSFAFLKALERNGEGHLYSSDFPYFRLPNPERLIGVLVPEELKERWSLLIDGDEANLLAIMAQVESVELFHYDSDKSVAGRAFAMSTVQPKLAEKALILMDDIQDNGFFHDYVQELRPESWHVLKFQSKYIGVIGEL